MSVPASSSASVSASGSASSSALSAASASLPSSHALFKQVAAAMVTEGERKKAYETRLSQALDHSVEVVGAVRHLSSAVLRRAEDAHKQQHKGGGGEGADESASATMGAHRQVKSAGSISLSSGLGLNLAPLSKPAGSAAAAALSQASAAAGGAATPASSGSAAASDAEVFAQVSRELASLESELPSLRTLKTARFHAVHAASTRAPLPPARSFPLAGMVAELEVVSRGTSAAPGGGSGGAPELAASHANMLAFLEHYPSVLAQLKFKLCTRWARFSVGLSTGLYENVEHMEQLGARLSEGLGQVQQLYEWARHRRSEFTSSGGGGGGAGGGSGSSLTFKTELLHSSDIEAYFRWLIPSLSAGKDLSRFLLLCKWMAFSSGAPQQPQAHAAASAAQRHAAAQGAGAALDIMAHFRQLRANPNVMDRDEEVRGLAAQTSTAAGANLHSMLEHTRARVMHARRRYVLNLPCLHLDEASLNTSIARIGTLSLVTPLEYENGHPLLNQLLKIFPALFEETAKRRAARMRSSGAAAAAAASAAGSSTDASAAVAAAASNIEMDRSAGIVYLKGCAWMAFNKWTSLRAPRRDRLNILMREKLASLSSLDSVLVSENSFLDCTHLEFVLGRLKHLSATALVKTLAHLRNDTSFLGAMEKHLAHLRKQQHQILFLNYTSVAVTGAAAAAAQAAAASAAAANKDEHSSESERRKDGSVAETEQEIHAAITPALPASATLSATVLVPPLPAVTFVPIAPNLPSNANTTPIVTTAASSATATAGATNPAAAAAAASSSSAAAAAAAFANAMPAPTPATLPAHKMHILFCLRFLRLRTLKDRVFSLLNFARSVERKLVLDEASFAFEDRFQFNAEHIIRTVPHTAPAPLKIMEKMFNANSAASAVSGGAMGLGAGGAGAAGGASSAAGATGVGSGAMKGADASSASIASGGHGLHARLPRLHTHLANYLPTDYETSEQAFMAFQGIERRDDTYKWRPVARERAATKAGATGGAAAVPVDEWEGDVQVDDCCGVPIVYDIVPHDFARLEEELMQLGSYVINEHRTRGGPSGSDASTAASAFTASSGLSSGCHDVVDRWSLLLDLWEAESEFQLLKARLLDVYLEMYEHMLVRTRQNELSAKMMELMALRPYIDLAQPLKPGENTTRYFTHFYALHSKLLLQRILFLRGLLDWQMSHEKQQAKRWEAQDWRVFLRTKRQMREAEEESATQQAVTAALSPRAQSTPSAPIAVSVAPSTARAGHQRQESDATRKARRELRLAQKLQRRAERQQKREEVARARDARVAAGATVTSDDSDSESSTSSSSSSDDDDDVDARRGRLNRRRRSSLNGADQQDLAEVALHHNQDKDALLDQLSALQIANSPSPFCRSFRVGMLDVLPSVALVLDLLKVMEATSKRLALKCTGGGSNSSSATAERLRPMDCFDKLVLDMAVLQHTSAAWSVHCQVKNSTLYDGSPHREILLSLEMSPVLHDPRAACAAIHAYSNSNIATEAAAALSALQPGGSPADAAGAAFAASSNALESAVEQENRDAQARRDAELKSKLSVAQTRRLKRLSNLVEIEDEDAPSEEDAEDEDASESARSSVDGSKSLLSAASIKKLAKASPALSPKNIVTASGFSITVSAADPAAANAASATTAGSALSLARASSARRPSALGSTLFSGLPSSHVELVVVAAQEKIKLLICINMLDAISMTTILLQQVFECHVLTGVYRRQAAAIGILSVRSLVDPYTVAFGEPSIEDPAPVASTASSTLLTPAPPSTFLLAIMETEETLPIALKDFTKVEQHLRLDPWLFHGYDQTVLGTSPAVTPGGVHSLGGRPGSPDLGSPRSLTTSSAGGTHSWSSRTSMISFQPGGRVRKFFHRPERDLKTLQSPPSSKIISALHRSANADDRTPPPAKGPRSAGHSKSPSQSSLPDSDAPSPVPAISLGGATVATAAPGQKSTKEKVLAALLEPIAPPRARGGAGGDRTHRRSGSAGSLKTLLQATTDAAESASPASSSSTKPRPLVIPSLPAGQIQIEMMEEDPLAVAAAQRRKRHSQERLSADSSTSEQAVTSPRAAAPPKKSEMSARPRSHSMWYIPSFYAAESESPKSSPNSAARKAAADAFATISADSSSAPETPKDGAASAGAAAGALPQSVIDANLPAVEQHLHRAQRRSLAEAQKSRAREKMRRARTQRVQAEREMAEEEKARRDALKAEEPRELCELWLLAFRRIVQAQLTHKHTLAVAVQFHDMLASVEDKAIEYLPPTSVFLCSSVAVRAPSVSEAGVGASTGGPHDSPFYSGSHTQGRPLSPHASQYSGLGGLSRSLGASLGVSGGGSMLTSPYGRNSSMGASPSPGMDASSGSVSVGGGGGGRFRSSSTNTTSSSHSSSSSSAASYARRVGCLTSRTFLFLDGLKAHLFEAFQARQHFNHASVGLNLAVAGLASAEDNANNPSKLAMMQSQAAKRQTAAAAIPQASGSSNQGMLWLRTKKEQDKLDGQSLHSYNLDILHALSVHIYILEAAQVASKFTFIHTVTLAGVEANPRTQLRTMTRGGPTAANSGVQEDDAISPFLMASDKLSPSSPSGASSSAVPEAGPGLQRPSSKYARLKAFPLKRGSSTEHATSPDAKGRTGAAAAVSSVSSLPVQADSDDLQVDDLFVHVNQQIIENAEPVPIVVAPVVVATQSSQKSGSTGSSGRGRSKQHQSLKGTGLNASRQSLHSSTAGSGKNTPLSSTHNLQAAAAPTAETVKSDSKAVAPNAEGLPAVAAAVPTPAAAAGSAAAAAGSVGALMLPSSDSEYSSSDWDSGEDDDDDGVAAEGMIDENEEQFMSGRSPSQIGQLRSNGTRVRAAVQSSTGFLFRIPRMAALLALLQDDRRSVIHLDHLKLDLLARQLLLDVFHLAHAVVMLEDLAVVAQPVADESVSKAGKQTTAITQPHMHAAQIMLPQLLQAAAASSPPSELMSIASAWLTVEQKKRLSVMLQRHVVVNGREISDRNNQHAAASAQHSRKHQLTMAPAAGAAADEGKDAAAADTSSTALLNTEAMTLATLDAACRISGLPDEFWHSLIEVLRSKRILLLNQLSLFVKMHHEMLRTSQGTQVLEELARNMELPADSRNGTGTEREVPASNSYGSTASSTTGGRATRDGFNGPSLGSGSMLRPSYAIATPGRGTASGANQALRDEYLDISDRLSVCRPSESATAQRAQSALLAASSNAGPHRFLNDTSRALMHPFQLTKFTAGLDSSLGGFKQAFEPALLLTSDPRVYRRKPETVIEAAHAAATNHDSGSSKHANGAANDDGNTTETAPRVAPQVSAFERDLMSHHELPPESLDQIIPALACCSGNLHLDAESHGGSWTGGGGTVLRELLQEIHWEYLPSHRGMRRHLQAHWKQFITLVHATAVVRALDAPKSMQGDRAIRRARRMAAEAAQRSVARAAAAAHLRGSDVVLKEVITSTYEPHTGVWKRTKKAGEAAADGKPELQGTPSVDAKLKEAAAANVISNDAAVPVVDTTTAPVSSSTPPAAATVVAVSSSTAASPVYSLERDLDSMESTSLKLLSLNQLLETTLLVTRMFDIYSSLKLQVIPMAVAGTPSANLNGRGAGSFSREDGHEWAEGLLASCCAHFKSSHVRRALSWFEQDILFRIRHPKKNLASLTTILPPAPIQPSDRSVQRRNKAQAFWKLVSSRIRQTGWLKQFKSNDRGLPWKGGPALSTDANGYSWTSPASILAAESAQLEQSFHHYRSHPLLQRRPFKSYASFGAYALSLTHVEQEEVIRYLKLDIEVLLLKQSILQLEQRSAHTLQKYAKNEAKSTMVGMGGASTATGTTASSASSGGSLFSSGSLDFHHKVAPIHSFLLGLQAHKMSLGQLLDDPAIQAINKSALQSKTAGSESKDDPPIPLLHAHSANPSAYFVVGEAEFTKALNTFARSVLYLSERQTMAKLLPLLERNHATNLALFSAERTVSCLRQQVLFQTKQCLLAADCNVLDVNYGLIALEHANLTQMLREARQSLRIRSDQTRSVLRGDHDQKVLGLLGQIASARKQFRRTKHMLERIIAGNIKRVKDSLMIAFLDGEFSQRALFSLFRQARETREKEMGADEAEALALQENAGIKSLFSASPSSSSASSPMLKLDNYARSDMTLAKQSVDSLKRSLLQRNADFLEDSRDSERRQQDRIAAAQEILKRHSELQERLASLQFKESHMLSILADLRYLLFHSELDSENFKRLQLRAVLEKKRLLSWRTDHIFRFQELKYRTAKYTSMKEVDNITQARERLEFSERELARLGREEVAHTIATVESERAFEVELARAEQELLDKRIRKMEAFNAMKAAIARVHSRPNADGSTKEAMPDAKQENIRLHQHKKMWDRCLFQTRVMQQEQLCLDLEAENETLRQVMEAKLRSDDIKGRQGLHAIASVVEIDPHPPLDGARTRVPQPVTVPDAHTLFPGSHKIDPWNGPSTGGGITSLISARHAPGGGQGVFLDSVAGGVHHSVHGFGPTSPVPPVPPSVYYLDPTSSVTVTAGHAEPLIAPFTKSIGRVFSNAHSHAAQVHPTAAQLTAHLHRVAHEHPALGMGLASGRFGATAQSIDAALGIPNSPRALTLATGLVPKKALSQSHRFAAAQPAPPAEESPRHQQHPEFSATGPLPRGRGNTTGGRMVGARLHSKLLRQGLQNAAHAPPPSHADAMRPSSAGISDLGALRERALATQEELDAEEEAAALRADREVESSITFPDVTAARPAASERAEGDEEELPFERAPYSRESSAQGVRPVITPRPPSSGGAAAPPAHRVSGSNSLQSASMASARASSPIVDFGAIGHMDMNAWRDAVLHLTESKQASSSSSLKDSHSARTMAQAAGSAVPRPSNNDWQNYGVMSARGAGSATVAASHAASLGQRSQPLRMFPGALSQRGMDAMPAAYFQSEAQSEAAAAPDAAYPSGSATARPANSRRNRAAAAVPVAPAAPAAGASSSKPTITRPPPLRKLLASHARPPLLDGLAATVAASASGGQLIATASTFQTLLPSGPALGLTGVTPARAAPVVIDSLPPSRVGANPNLSSGIRARSIQRATIQQSRATAELRLQNDARFEENKFVGGQ